MQINKIQQKKSNNETRSLRMFSKPYEYIHVKIEEEWTIKSGQCANKKNGNHLKVV